jgi:hypothetical protein
MSRHRPKSSNYHEPEHRKAKRQPDNPRRVYALTLEFVAVIVIGLAVGKFLIPAFSSYSHNGESISEVDAANQPSENPRSEDDIVASDTDRPLSCKDFKTQKAAQFVLGLDPTDPFNLDGDDNSLACESLKQGKGGDDPDDLNCTDFASAAAAQFVLDHDRSDPHQLDRDGDGKACESL